MNPQLPALAVIPVAISLVAVPLLAQGPGAKPSENIVSVAKPAKGVVPRLPDGYTDLGGFWSNNTAIPLELPEAYAGREFLTDDEAKAVEQGSKERTLAADHQATEWPAE